MNRKADNESFLADVLAEAAPADLRDAMLGDTLRRVRRRRRWRQTRRAAALTFALGLCGFWVWQRNLPSPSAGRSPAMEAVARNYQLVPTRPLPPNAFVVSRPLAAGQIITSAESVARLPTIGGAYRAINDAELLALVTSHPAVLVRTGPHSEELVFANPEDQKGFPLN
jgi:hypothetical protein